MGGASDRVIMGGVLFTSGCEQMALSKFLAPQNLPALPDEPSRAGVGKTSLPSLAELRLLGGGGGGGGGEGLVNCLYATCSI